MKAAYIFYFQYSFQEIRIINMYVILHVSEIILKRDAKKQSGKDIMSQILKVLSASVVLTMIKRNNKKVYTNAYKTMCIIDCLVWIELHPESFTEKVNNSWNNQTT